MPYLSHHTHQAHNTQKKRREGRYPVVCVLIYQGVMAFYDLEVTICDLKYQGRGQHLIISIMQTYKSHLSPIQWMYVYNNNNEQ